VADRNAWTPCPLLLTKDGNMQADAMIAAGIAKYRVSTGTDTYASFGSWLNTLNGWYDGDVVNDKVIYQTLANDWYLEATPKFISEKAIDFNGGYSNSNAQNVKSSGTSNLEFTVSATYNAVPETFTLTIDKIVDGTDNCHVVTPTSVTITKAAMEAAHATGEPEDQIHTIDLNQKVTWASDVHGVPTTSTENISLKLTHAQWATLMDNGTVAYTQKNVAWTRTVNVTDRVALCTGWKQEIIGYVDSDDDFYGIILGGKKAVSNDKRDDLEKTVKNFSYEDQIFTVGSDAAKTIQLVDDHGVRNTYAYLEPVKSQLTLKNALTGIDSRLVADCKGDVYHIYGTDSYVVAVFDKAGDLINWIYYYGGTAQLYTDWK